jgi:antitoxin ParD1/3/4
MQTVEKMSITLPAEMARAIRAKVEGGGYASQSEVIREAVRGWMERERHQATLNAAIDRGIAGIEAGAGQSTEDVRRRLTERLQAKKNHRAP